MWMFVGLENLFIVDDFVEEIVVVKVKVRWFFSLVKGESMEWVVWIMFFSEIFDWI